MSNSYCVNYSSNNWAIRLENNNVNKKRLQMSMHERLFFKHLYDDVGYSQFNSDLRTLIRNTWKAYYP